MKHRSIILLGLIAALLAGGLVGWLWGDNMLGAVEAREGFLKAGKAYRSALYTENTETLSERVTEAERALNTARADKVAHPGDIRARVLVPP